MNKKLTVKTEHGNICYCVLDPDISFEIQLNELAGFSGDGGVTVRYYEDRIEFVDYFHAEVMACFPIISLEDTSLPVCLKWVKIR